MNKKKTATMVASLALVGAIGVGSTLAYLSSQGNKLTNSFDVGDAYNPVGPDDQAVWIDEADLDKTDNSDDNITIGESVRTLTGNEYTDVLAGSVFTKDPILRITNDSVDSYGYIQVTGITANHGITIDRRNWEQVVSYDEDGDYGNGIWRYRQILQPGEGTLGEDVIDYNAIASTSSLFLKANTGFEVNVPGDFDEETLGEITLKGLAVQARYNNNGTVTEVPTDEADEFAIDFNWTSIN